MKKILLGTFSLLLLLCVNGCKKDSMEGITIYTTTYPIEYITDKLYGNYSTVLSTYPNEVIELSDKLIKDYSNSDLFVYNGLSEERNYAVKMLNYNKSLMIVDSSMGMDLENNVEELWIDPSNFLMLCLNIRNGMKEYITNSFLRKEIDDNYNKLKISISELDAEIKLLVKNADDKNILVSNSLFNYLKKYDVNVYNFENNNNLTNKLIADVKSLIDNKKIKYIVMLPNDTLTDEIEKFLTNNNIEKIYFDPLTILTDDNKNNGKDYLSVMNDNLNILKKELYDEN